MRLYEFTILKEGGNIWKNDLATTRIKKEQVIPTVKFLEKITGLPLVNNMLGSTGIKADSGDIDLAVDASKISKDELIQKLKNWSKKNDPSALTKKTGISVHFRCPIEGNLNNNRVQVDFMFIDNIPFAKWGMKTVQNTEYKNTARNIVIASLAKTKNLRFSYTRGLVDRDTDTPIPHGTNTNYIAKILLNPSAKSTDLESIEAILLALKNDPNKNEKLADARETLGKQGIKF